MRYTEIRQTLRAARVEKGMTQRELAESSGTSRVTIARIEAGSAGDVRMGTITSLCDALGLEIVLEPAGAGRALATRLAREQEKNRRLELRRRHALLGARLLCEPAPSAAALVSEARAAVDRWERENLCSDHYVTRWRTALAGPVESVAAALFSQTEWSDALFQNSPWGFALEAAG